MDFNPQIPAANDPNYFKYSEPIRGVEADKSTGIALSTVGQGIGDLADIAKQAAHDYINKDVRATVDPIRDQFTSQLEAARASIVPSPVQTGSGSTTDIMTGGSSPTSPTAITNAVSKLSD